VKCEHDPIHCIVPIHVLQAMADSDDPRVSNVGRRALVNAARMGVRRGLLAGMHVAVATGEKRRTIYDAEGSSHLPGKLVRSESDDPAKPFKDRAVKEAWEGLGATYDLFSQVYGRNSIDGNGLRLDGTVHYNDNNAYWDGRQMVFGDGDGVVFTSFTGAIDVIGHELTHGVTQYTANLEYHKQSGALNESMSDVFGSLVKQFVLKQTAASADWLIGAGILGPEIHGKALRSMKAPGTAYDDPRLGGKDPQPAHMKNYVDLPDDYLSDWGGVHINSGIPNHAFYLLAMSLGGHAWEDAGHIWYATLKRLWATASFQDCANVSVEAANTLFGAGSRQQQATANAWASVGLPPVTQAKPKSPWSTNGAAAAESSGVELKMRLQLAVESLQRATELM
jgi:Zn-dependent metalloprotease